MSCDASNNRIVFRITVMSDVQGVQSAQVLECVCGFLCPCVKKRERVSGWRVVYRK